MKQFSKLMLVVLGSSALILGLSMLPSEKAEGKDGSAPVVVTNTPLPVNVSNTANVNVASSTTLPVSVTGTPDVNITGSSTLPVTLSGAVDLASGTSVLVGNTTNGSGNPVPLVTRNADGPAGSAMQVELCDQVGGSTGCDSQTNSSGTSTTVPSGQRLVIQFASGECVAPSGSFATVELQTSVGTTTFDHEILLHPVSSTNISEMSQRVQVYADPSSTVHLFDTEAGGTMGYCTLGISGYTVPYTPAP